MAKSNLKKGRLSLQERRFIEENIKSLGLIEVCSRLKRDKKCVEKYALDRGISFGGLLIDADVEKNAIIANLEQSPEWDIIKKEFDADERKYFSHRYAKFYMQFKNDILATEESQLIQLIKFELLSSRALRDARICKGDCDNLEKVLAATYAEIDTKKSMGDNITSDLVDKINSLQTQISALRTANSIKVKEVNDLTARTQALIKELKGTREQRIQRATNSKQNWGDLLKMLEDEQVQQLEGRQMELLKISTKKEYERLGDYHEFMNGEVDRPILNSETVERE